MQLCYEANEMRTLHSGFAEREKDIKVIQTEAVLFKLNSLNRNYPVRFQEHARNSAASLPFKYACYHDV